jgi:5-methyltetrahydrofolate--homocysteine methyltransferase
LIKKLINLVQSLTDVPICIDSSVPAALEAGLEAAKGRPLLNSVTGEEERLETILPLVKKYNVPVVAISNDDTGISEDPEVRFQVAKKIIERAADYGIPKRDIVVDPLVMPIGAMSTAGLQVFDLVKKLREIGVNSTCGASNISFGLPNRHGINASYLSMAICSGLTSAIMNPTNENEINAIRAADLLMNHDANGAKWIKSNRIAEEGSVSTRGSRRRRLRT